MAISFKDKVAIVTGAGGGLGKAYALMLGKLGAKVVVNDLGGALDGSGGNSSAAEATVAEIKKAGGQAIANGASVSDLKGVDGLIKDTLNAFGTIDILINNAGILRDKSFKKVTVDDFKFVLDVHLMGSLYCTKAVWPIMDEKGYGRIVMTTSSSGLYGNFGQTNYAAAKMGLVGFMNALKIEGQKKNIHVNSIAPTGATRMTETLLPPDAIEKLKPELVAPAVLYLCSEEAPTGCIIEAGAGYYSKVHVVEGKGVKLGSSVTVDDIAKNWDKITDMSEAQPYGAGPDIVVKIFQD
jgi:NAD(P)-dependent dehydrogenase (short-subunit alcohol dehydrogenase family)